MEVVFCVNDHLMLHMPCCPECGWRPPKPVLSGEMVWVQNEASPAMSGRSRGGEARLAVLDNTIALATQTVVSAFQKTNGEILWKAQFSQGRIVRGLIPFEKSFLAAVCDERSIEQAQFGGLYQIDPKNGSISLFWEANSHSISQPVIVSADRMIFRTGADELVFLSLRPQIQIEGRVKLKSWWPTADLVMKEDGLVVVDGKVMQNKGDIAIYDVKTRQEVWRQPTNGLVTSTPVVYSDLVIYQDGETSHQNVKARRWVDGSIAWNNSFLKIYSPLLAAKDRIYIIVRGNSQPQAVDHYQLAVMDALSGSIISKQNLVEKVISIGFYPPDIILMVNISGKLTVFDMNNAAELWSLPITTAEDPLRTHLTAVDNLLVAGFASGKVKAFQMRPSEEEDVSPQIHLQNERYKEAAEAFALRDEVLEAAKIFDKYLRDPNKAWQLYHKGGDFENAARVALEAGLLKIALNCYQDSGNIIGQAETHYQMGNLLEAAGLMEKAGELEKAAQWFIEFGDLARVYEIYMRLGLLKEAHEILNQMPEDAKRIGLLEKEGKFKEAGDLAAKMGKDELTYLEKAVELYHRCPDQQAAEIGVLEQLTKQKPESWSLERLAELAEGEENFEKAAHTRHQINDFRKAAEDFEKAAEKVGNLNANKSGELYEQASACYREISEDEEEQRCNLRMTFLLKLPRISVKPRVGKVFNTNTMGQLDLFVINEGFGPACDFSVTPSSSIDQYFEVDKDSFKLENKIFKAAKENKPISLYIKPKIKGEVPLRLEIKWRNSTGERNYSQAITLTLNVVSESEHTSSGNQPITIINTGNGPVIMQQENGVVEMPDGDVVNGDKFNGSKVESGGQIGDKVVVNRWTGEGGTIKCSNCRRQLGQGQTVCPYCGKKIDDVGDHSAGCGDH